MPQQVLAESLSRKLKPLCPRDNRIMHFEAKGIEWETDGETHTTPSYHCDFEGCSVRYTPSEGYFTVIDMPDLPHFVEEPGTNILQCPVHGTWLYQSDEPVGRDRQSWRCGVDGCEYTRADDAAAPTGRPNRSTNGRRDT
jgi:hypothetical protein